MKNNSFIESSGILWEGVLKGVKKSQDKLQPLYEAFTNSFEAILLCHNDKEKNEQKKIDITLNYASDLLSPNAQLNSIVITDNGIGFDEENFKRFCTYKDTRKGFNNRGSGRIQFVHYFNAINFRSTYLKGTEFETIYFKLSKNDKYLNYNSIIFFEKTEPASTFELYTEVVFDKLIDDADQNLYREITSDELKTKILERYIQLFCAYRENLPKITIKRVSNNGKEIDSSEILLQDIPEIDSEVQFDVNYSRVSADFKRIETIGKVENFKIKTFKILSSKLEKNEIKLTSKNEIVEGVQLKLNCLASDDIIDDNRYLFLVSSRYIDELDEDTRGEFIINNKTDFRKNAKAYGVIEDEILLDEIIDSVNQKIVDTYDEVRLMSEQHENKISELKDIFLLNDHTISALKFSINDDEAKILEKVYQADSKIIAEGDATLKKQIENIENLDPSKDDYRTQLNEKVKEFAKQIPLQNRTSLTQYVARRKLVLELYRKILDKMSNESINEDVLHNLLFQQHSTDAFNSDLWLLNEDFIYFDGTSESSLSNIKVNGEVLFRKELDEEEKKYIHSLGEDRFKKRPDILLFPSESKCIIIEFKKPEVNVADHLNQIKKYAGLIHNFCRDEKIIHTYYGYLIGQSMNYKEIQNIEPEYQFNYNFNFLFRPNFPVLGNIVEPNRLPGSMYSEIITYSTILERARLRNSIFIDILTKKQNSLESSENLEVDETD
jgi:hypothetical protein